MAAVVDFGNLKSDLGLAKLNEYMGSHSYVTGFNLSQDDVLTYGKLLASPSVSKLPHANRWYRHISAFTEAQRFAWPKGKMPLPSTGGEKKGEEEEFDLFGDDSNNAEAAKALAAKRKDAAASKKKKEVINKSSLVMEVKPNSVDTDLEKVWELVKAIQIAGVTWGQGHKKVPVAFGLFKLQVSCVILDDIVDTEEIIERIEALGMDPKEAEERRRKRESTEEEDEEEEEEDEDEESPGLVQSAEIVSFNKL